MASGEKEETDRQRNRCACVISQKKSGCEDDIVMHDTDCSLGECLSAEEPEEVNAEVNDGGLPSPQIPKDILSITIEQDQFDLMKIKNKLLLARFLEVEEDKRKAEEEGAALPSQRKQLDSSIIRRPQKEACQGTHGNRRGTQSGAEEFRWSKKRRVFFSPTVELKPAKRCYLNLKVHLSKEMNRTVCR